MRWLFRIGLALALLVGLPIAALSFYFDEAVSRAATYALGVETRAIVLLRPLSERISVVRLQVKNPPGFESRRFLDVDRGRFDLRTRSLREETIVSPLLRLDGVQLSLERRDGRYNYVAILENLEKFESDEEAGNEPPDETGGTQFVIRRLEILDVVADVDTVELLGDNGRMHVEVDEIRLDDVGGSEGVSMAELSNIIVKALLTAIARSGAGLPGEMLGAMRGGLGNLGGVGVDVGGQVKTTSLKSGNTIVSNVADSAVENAVEDAAQAVGTGAGKALNGLGRLLGGDEED